MSPPLSRTQRRHRTSCGSGKRQYLTYQEAVDALNRWIGPRAPTLAVYGCENCGMFHHGRQPGGTMAAQLLPLTTTEWYNAG